MNKIKKNCWEYWNCEEEVKKKCPAFKSNSGGECWMIAGSCTKNKSCQRLKKQYDYCWECEWYKIVNPED